MKPSLAPRYYVYSKSLSNNICGNYTAFYVEGILIISAGIWLLSYEEENALDLEGGLVNVH